MNLEQTRFGTVEYGPEDVITFDQGLIGFPALRNFIMILVKQGSPFRWLQSLNEPAMAILVADPLTYLSEYAPEVDEKKLCGVVKSQEDPVIVLCTANIPAGQPQNLTLNLAGPIVINVSARKGIQVVVDDPAYTTKYRVFQEAGKDRSNVAA